MNFNNEIDMNNQASKNQNQNIKNNSELVIYQNFRDEFENNPFILIIGKYDHVLGPRALYSSVPLKDDNFIRNLLRDALNTKNEFTILDFNQFYSQVYKVEIEDRSARGGKQLYAIIILRDIEYPLIPNLHFTRIAKSFQELDHQRILADDKECFTKFFSEISDTYIKKGEVLPLESQNLQIRSGVNTIQGFCELMLEQIKMDNELSKDEILIHLKMILDSCQDIINALKKPTLSIF